MNRLLFSVSLSALLVLQINHLHAQDKLIDTNCSALPGACGPEIDCEPSNRQAEERSCRRCLLAKPLLGGCAVVGNDPDCEATKAAKRATAEVERSRAKQKCEEERSARSAECNARIAQEQAACEIDRMAATGNAINIFQHVLVSGGKGQPKQIPQQVMDKLVESGLYDPIYLNSIEVLQLGSRLDVPPPLSDKQFGITIGNRIFLYDINEIEELPIGFWIEQLELSRLFAVYGVPEFGRAIEADPNGIDTLVDRKVAQTCKIISC